ncbi:MAG: phosphoribosylformylglycinamidine synthase subunit PurL [Bacteroidetes bacterium]|nr:phosphoribosylformylglycinamidine synthase subunit PurL [Bacteroidota bacterium]MCL5738738.1 phosphoribosylformylglycinamidine synthase subunit PurL [Bacteroidota bacterium]
MNIEVNAQIAQEMGLTPEEFQKIKEILGRTPTHTELGVYSVMWSEHASYKNSILQLKKLPRSGKNLLVSAGEENAGLVDIGDGLAVAFKIESHNHPSAVEPYQGAATGVGGILRDIFTMGARPVAALDSLRFGNPDNPRVKYLLENVVKGIADYGNAFGVPTVAGEIYFDECYDENPLVNAMAVGIVRHNRVAKAAAKGVGNLVMIVGSSTGRDGIHGATFASEDISEASEAKRPSVQVGDPFTEKLLLEATLEAIEAGVVVGIQDMGAAGIACSTSEMSAKAGTGMDVNLDLVPLRESDMSAYEIMLSESQERMLVVLKPEDEAAIKKIFSKWDLNAEVIGKVTDDGILRIRRRGKVEAEIPSKTLALGEGAPVYVRESRKPEYIDKLAEFDSVTLPEPKDYNEVLKRLVSSPDIASKKYVFEQYDYMVGTDTVVLPGEGDASVIRLGRWATSESGKKRGLVVKTDCNARYVYLDPKVGAEHAVVESARNVACVGAKPVAITNCLNFGNPYKQEVYYQFEKAVEGITKACTELETPVTGGNVSFYNESPNRAVYPTPVIGMLGIIEDASKAVRSSFRKEGDLIAVIGLERNEMGGSEYLKIIHNVVSGKIPPVDYDYERHLHEFLQSAAQADSINSAHDISEGGLAVTLAECCIMDQENMIGAKVALDFSARKDFVLFGEGGGRVIISFDPDKSDAVLSLAKSKSLTIEIIGAVSGENLQINDTVNVTLKELSSIYYSALPSKFATSFAI